jgi:hypothetical protein
MRRSNTDNKFELKKYFIETFRNYIKNLAFFLMSILSYSIIFILIFAFINFQVGLLIFLCLFLISFISFFRFGHFRKGYEDSAAKVR